MDTDSLKPADRLRAVAAAQGGFFTATQAKSAGYIDEVHGYHVTRGHWKRHDRGIYSLVDVPLSPYAEVIRWSLWTRDREDRVQGVASRETAAWIHGLIPEPPARIHLIVPKSFRKRADEGDPLELVKADLTDDEVVQHEGFRVTSLRRTVADLNTHVDHERISHAARTQIAFYSGTTRPSSSTYDAIIARGED